MSNFLNAPHRWSRGRKRPTDQSIDRNKFDFLVFTQSWSPTKCFLWMERSSKNLCSLPKNDEWTVHGLWPSRHKSWGPSFCNHTERFSSDKIDSLKPQMETKWRDLHKNSKPDWFWMHEWRKHGTCAGEILNSQYEYFSKCLELFDRYNMKDVLTKANILPNQKYNFQDYLDGVEKVLGKKSQITCAKDKVIVV